MKRSLQGAVAILALSTVIPVFAADYPTLRPGYPDDWEASEDSLRFESGLRYWYSWGKQEASFGPTALSVEDQTHSVEVHGRIDDLETQTYVKGMAGLGVATTGSYTLTPAPTASIGGDSTIGYIGGDFGWLPFGQMQDGVAVGGLIGYQYWKDAPDIGRGNFVTGIDAGGVPTGFDNSKDNLDIHALRLGLRGTAEINDMFDIQAEVAAVPYAWVTGTLGPHEVNGVPIAVPGLPGSTTMFKSSGTELTGRGYGAMGEVMVGFHPTKNLTARVGGRAWYLEGQLDATFDSYLVNNNGGVVTVLEQGVRQASDYARLLRYGAMFELTGRF